MRALIGRFRRAEEAPPAGPQAPREELLHPTEEPSGSPSSPWDLSGIPDTSMHPGICAVLNQCFSHFPYKDYPIVINDQNELAWKEDKFFVDFLTYIRFNGFTELAMTERNQALRKRLYQRMGYSLKEYSELWWKKEEEEAEAASYLPSPSEGRWEV